MDLLPPDRYEKEESISEELVSSSEDSDMGDDEVYTASSTDEDEPYSPKEFKDQYRAFNSSMPIKAYEYNGNIPMWYAPMNLQMQNQERMNNYSGPISPKQYIKPVIDPTDPNNRQNMNGYPMMMSAGGPQQSQLIIVPNYHEQNQPNTPVAPTHLHPSMIRPPPPYVQVKCSCQETGLKQHTIQCYNLMGGHYNNPVPQLYKHQSNFNPQPRYQQQLNAYSLIRQHAPEMAYERGHINQTQHVSNTTRNVGRPKRKTVLVSQSKVSYKKKHLKIQEETSSDESIDVSDDYEEENEHMEDDIELAESYVEKILAAVIVPPSKAFEFNYSRLAICSDLYAINPITGSTGTIESLKADAKSISDDRTTRFLLIKPRGQSYIHIELISPELVSQERGGAHRLSRFESSPTNWEYGTSLENIIPPEYQIPEKVLFEGYSPNGSKVPLCLTKWKAFSLHESTWESRSLLLTIKNGPEVLKNYDSDVIPPPKKLELANILNKPHMPAYIKADEQLDSPCSYKLRNYQVDGVNWLLFCWCNYRSCIIADEMGLGKTIQSSTFLNIVARKCNIPGPFMVVAPLSTLGNWQRELQTWTHLKVLVYRGKQEERDLQYEYEFFYRDKNNKIPLQDPICKFDVLLTTYEMCLNGNEHLNSINWEIGVFDEAHRLKNHQSKATIVLKSFRFVHKVLLTGTPLQNSLDELWSLLNFIQPHKFPNKEVFIAEYGNLHRDEDVTKLQELLKPIMLRRLKEDVETSIPVKEETIVEVELTPIQKRFYRAILEKNFDHLLRASAAPPLLNVVMELRKCCIHPYLIRGAKDKILSEAGLDNSSSENDKMKTMIQASGKLVFVDKLLQKLRPMGKRVLIFSQMTMCLDILADFFHYRGWPFERIDGSVRSEDRQSAIDRFCDPESGENAFLFLLCTRAGGVGINLVAADTVIIFDSDWNPQNDIQAQARCHRIGQQHPVKVYRLITRGTYEREMLDRAGHKLGLDKVILQRMGGTHGGASGGSTNLHKMSKNEIENILKKGAYGVVMDDSESARFCQEDIDKILENRTTVVKHGGENEPNGTPSSIFSKATFTSTSEGEFDVDLDAPDFWERWAKRNLEIGKKKEEELEKETLKSKKRRNTIKNTSLDYLETDFDDSVDAEESPENVEESNNRTMSRVLKDDSDEEYTDSIGEDLDGDNEYLPQRRASRPIKKNITFSKVKITRPKRKSKRKTDESPISQTLDANVDNNEISSESGINKQEKSVKDKTKLPQKKGRRLRKSSTTTINSQDEKQKLGEDSKVSEPLVTNKPKRKTVKNTSSTSIVTEK